MVERSICIRQRDRYSHPLRTLTAIYKIFESVLSLMRFRFSDGRAVDLEVKHNYQLNYGSIPVADFYRDSIMVVQENVDVLLVRVRFPVLPINKIDLGRSSNSGNTRFGCEWSGSTPLTHI